MTKGTIDINKNTITIYVENKKIIKWEKEEWQLNPQIIIQIARAIKIALIKPEELLKMVRTIE